MESVSIETYKLIAEAGIRLGQANPNKPVQEILDMLLRLQQIACSINKEQVDI